MTAAFVHRANANDVNGALLPPKTEYVVGPGACFWARHPTAVQPSFLQSNGCCRPRPITS
jgi:hypothetical protein